MPKLILNRFPGGTMTKQALRCIALGAICLTATLSALTAPLHAAPAAQAGKTRTYYVAADEVQLGLRALRPRRGHGHALR